MRLRPYKPETIINVLRFVRAEIVRERLDGLDHVGALLRMRGDNLVPVPRKIRRPCGRAGVSRQVIAALREGAKPRAHLRERLQAAYGLDHGQADMVAHNAIQRLRMAGLLRLDGRLWEIRPSS